MQNRSNGCLDCSVRLGTLKDGDTYAHLITTRSKAPCFSAIRSGPLAQTVADVNGYRK